jgi:hypothetical protein
VLFVDHVLLASLPCWKDSIVDLAIVFVCGDYWGGRESIVSTNERTCNTQHREQQKSATPNSVLPGSTLLTVHNKDRNDRA